MSITTSQLPSITEINSIPTFEKDSESQSTSSNEPSVTECALRYLVVYGSYISMITPLVSTAVFLPYACYKHIQCTISPEGEQKQASWALARDAYIVAIPIIGNICSAAAMYDSMKAKE